MRVLALILLLAGAASAQRIVPNMPVPPAKVTLPITCINPSPQPCIAKLNVPPAATTITVCASGCTEPLTRAGWQAAIATATTDCATQTDYIQVTGVVTDTELTFSSGCTGNNFIVMEPSPTVLAMLPPDGQRIFDAVSGSLLPEFITTETTQAGILFNYGATNIVFRGIKVSNTTNIMDGALIQYGNDTAPIVASQVVQNIVMDQVDLACGGNQCIRGIFGDAENQAVINSDLGSGGGFVFVGGDAQCWTQTAPPGPTLFTNNNCVGGGENIIIGASGTTETTMGGRMPIASDITVGFNFFYKPYKWRMTPCSSTVGPNCGTGAVFVNYNSIVTSNCGAGSCEVDVNYKDAIQQDVHPLDDVDMSSCSATAFNSTNHTILASPLPANTVTTALTFSYTDTNLNSSSPGNGASAGTGCTFLVHDPQYVAPSAGGNYDIKDLFEIKEGARIWVFGNIFANTWSNGQAEILQYQETNPTLSSGSAFYTPWAHITDINTSFNWLDGGDNNGYGSVSALVDNSVIINGVTGDSEGITGPVFYGNNMFRHLGPELGNHLQFNSEWASTQPSANATLQDTQLWHNDFWMTDVDPAKDGMSFSGFTPPAGQLPFVRLSVHNNIIDMTSQFGGVVIQPTGCKSGGVTVTCLLPAQWYANIPLGTVTGSGLGGCSSALLIATIQPNAGPAGVGSSFCPSTTHESLGYANTTPGGSITAGVATVTPASMSNIVVGQWYTIGGGPNLEFFSPTAITGSTFTATFVNNHNATENIQGATLPISSAAHNAATDGSDIGPNSNALVNLVKWVPSGVYPGSSGVK